MQGSGISSESIWTAFDNATTAFMRTIRYALKVAWTRVEDPDAGFAIVGTSVVGGTDIVKGQGSAITTPDAYSYFDETTNTIRIEYDRQIVEPLGGMALAMLDVVLDNTNDRFSPNQNATIGTAIEPKKPIKAHIGLHVQSQDKTLQIFEGLTRTPQEVKGDRTVRISCVDFAKYLNDYTLDSELYTDTRSDVIIQDILVTVGFGSSQYNLGTGLNTIGYAWFDKTQTAGERIKKVCEAEGAFFYQDENGILRFENRNRDSDDRESIWTIHASDILAWEYDRTAKIINECTVKAKPREEQALQVIWTDALEEQIPASESITVWTQLEDPVTSITTPSATTDYTAFTATGGGGGNITADISIVISKFATASKMVITNNNANLAYLNFLQLRGTPATVVGELLETVTDTDSRNKYDYEPYTITNDFIQDRKFASDLADQMVNSYATPNQRVRITVQGIPHLQLRDRVEVYDPNTGEAHDYYVVRIRGVVDAGGFIQTLTLRKPTPLEYPFARIGISVIEGDEVVGT